LDPDPSPCFCVGRPDWARIEDDAVMRWPVLDLAEWEELRHCPVCGSVWLAVWPDDINGGLIFCRPHPSEVRRLRDLDRVATLRPYCLARLEDHYGTLDERNSPCRKVGCAGKRIGPTRYCLEHLIAERFGRQLARLETASSTR